MMLRAAVLALALVLATACSEPPKRKRLDPPYVAVHFDQEALFPVFGPKNVDILMALDTIEEKRGVRLGPATIHFTRRLGGTQAGAERYERARVIDVTVREDPDRREAILLEIRFEDSGRTAKGAVWRGGRSGRLVVRCGDHPVDPEDDSGAVLRW